LHHHEGGREDTITGIIRKDVEHAHQKGPKLNGQGEVEKTNGFPASKLKNYVHTNVVKENPNGKFQGV
jgi:hypothetical protein